MEIKGPTILSLILYVVTLGILHQTTITYVKNLSYNNKQISIERDSNNIPQIHAGCHESALYAWGYVTAEDRMFQLAFRRQTVRGRLSQLLGGKTVDIDILFREIDLYGWAVKSAERLKRENITEYRSLYAYAQGINHHFASLTFKPLEFWLIGLEWYEWQVADVLSMFKLMKWSLSTGMTEQYVRSSLLNKFSKEQIDQFLPYTVDAWMKGEFATQATIVRKDEIPMNIIKSSQQLDLATFKPIKVQEMINTGYFSYLNLNERASNSWVISGNLTQSGHALLCNDPHLDSALPGEWHQVKIFYPSHKGKQVYLIGASLTGLPSIIGKTSYVSLTMTTSSVDTQDLFREQIQDDKYLIDGEWKPLKIRTEIIKVKGKDDVLFKVYETHRGPLISRMLSKGYLYHVSEKISLAWVGFCDSDYVSVTSYARMAEITEHSELIDIVEKCQDYGPPFNLLYSTADNHIGFHTIGLTPIRSHPHIGMYIKDGTTTEHDWKGFLQGSNRLHMQDPARGYIVSANNKAAEKEYFNGIFDVGVYTGRADRLEAMIEEQIRAGRKFNKQFMSKMQMDTVDVYCLELVRVMKNKIATGNQAYKSVFGVFEDFDCDFTPEATVPSIYLAFLQNLYEQLHPQGQNRTLVLAHFPSFFQYIYSFILQPKHSASQMEKLVASHSKCLSELESRFSSPNTSTYRYSKFHQDLMIHRPFSFSPLLQPVFEWQGPGLGNMNTPNIGFMNKFHDKDYRTNHRANLRVIISYVEDSWWIIDGGVSEKAYSDNYCDQRDIFMSGGYLVMDAANRTTTIQ